jgi:hypothetical protein
MTISSKHSIKDDLNNKSYNSADAPLERGNSFV